MCTPCFCLLTSVCLVWFPWGQWFWGRENTEATLCCVSQGADVWVLLFFWGGFFSSFPSCHGVPSSQMDAVKQLNDACFPLLALAIAAVYMQSGRQTSCNPHKLIYIWALCNHINITLSTAEMKGSVSCNERYVIQGGF